LAVLLTEVADPLQTANSLVFSSVPAAQLWVCVFVCDMVATEALGLRASD